uniref:Uncharacterized protein n=1 Tax=Anguilla anguilla TaxID=7936 RepID=A0A0E9SD73_ANGAN
MYKSRGYDEDKKYNVIYRAVKHAVSRTVLSVQTDATAYYNMSSSPLDSLARLKRILRDG